VSVNFGICNAVWAQKTQFLLHISMLMHAECDIVMANPSVCLSVCLSVTPWYCIKTNAYIAKSLPSGWGMTSFSQHYPYYRHYKIPRETSSVGH